MLYRHCSVYTVDLLHNLFQTLLDNKKLYHIVREGSPLASAGYRLILEFSSHIFLLSSLAVSNSGAATFKPSTRRKSTAYLRGYHRMVFSIFDALRIAVGCPKLEHLHVKHVDDITYSNAESWPSLKGISLPPSLLSLVLNISPPKIASISSGISGPLDAGTHESMSQRRYPIDRAVPGAESPLAENLRILALRGEYHSFADDFLGALPLQALQFPNLEALKLPVSGPQKYLGPFLRLEVIIPMRDTDDERGDEQAEETVRGLISAVDDEKFPELNLGLFFLGN